jgi:hypothetical protein
VVSGQRAHAIQVRVEEDEARMREVELAERIVIRLRPAFLYCAGETGKLAQNYPACDRFMARHLRNSLA